MPRVRTGLTPLLKGHARFLKTFADSSNPAALIQSATPSQLKSLQEVLYNVKCGLVPLPPDVINMIPRRTLGNALNRVCCSTNTPATTRNHLLKPQRGGLALGGIAKVALPIVLESLLSSPLLQPQQQTGRGWGSIAAQVGIPILLNLLQGQQQQ